MLVHDVLILGEGEEDLSDRVVEEENKRGKHSAAKQEGYQARGQYQRKSYIFKTTSPSFHQLSLVDGLGMNPLARGAAPPEEALAAEEPARKGNPISSGGQGGGQG